MAIAVTKRMKVAQGMKRRPNQMRMKSVPLSYEKMCVVSASCVACKKKKNEKHEHVLLCVITSHTFVTYLI